MVVDGDSARENLCCVLCGEKGHPASYSKCSVAVAERKREEARRSRMAPRQRQAAHPRESVPLSKNEQKRRFGNMNQVPAVVNSAPAPRGAWGQQQWLPQQQGPNVQRHWYDDNEQDIMAQFKDFQKNIMGMMERMATMFCSKLQMSNVELNSILHYV